MFSILAKFKSCLDMALAGYDNTSSGYYSLKLYDIEGIILQRCILNAIAYINQFNLAPLK